MTWTNLLIYADARPETELALNEGLRLATHSGGRLSALDVVKYEPVRSQGISAEFQDDLSRLIQEQRYEQLHDQLERLPTSRPVDIEVICGNPAFELIRRAHRGRHDLVVKAARGRDSKHTTSFGTTALHLVRKSPVPVLIVSADRKLLECPAVLCAIELEDSHASQNHVRDLLRSARALAEVHDAPLHVVHVIDTGRLAAYHAFLSPDVFARFVEGRRAALESELEFALSGGLSGLKSVHAHLLEGDPADTIVDLVDQLNISHLVLGSVGHNEPGFFIGNVAEDVLSRAACSVLTLKPTGFETPIAVGSQQPGIVSPPQREH